MRAILVAAMLAAGAAKADESPVFFRWEQPKMWEVAPLVVADALIWIDVVQTRHAVSHGPVNESNPLLGQHPNSGRVFWIGGVASTIAMTAGWYALPSKWRVLLPAGVIGGEGYAVVFNSFHF